MGRSGELPWHLPADLLHFKALTIGKPVVMGRKTFASIRKPLKLRRNIVLTRDRSLAVDGIEVAHAVGEVLALCERAGEIAVIGGAEVFDAFADLVDCVYATEIDAHIEGDVFFKMPERPHAAEVTGELPPDERNAHALRFVRYDFTARRAY